MKQKNLKPSILNGIIGLTLLFFSTIIAFIPILVVGLI